MAVLGPVLGVLILTAAFVLVTRWIARRSRVIALVFAAAVLVRLAAGVTLTSLAAFDLPLFDHLRYPDEVWLFAPDARTYQRAATAIANDGWTALKPSMPSRNYIVCLALWMEVVGTGRGAGFMLNLLLFIGYGALVVRVFDSQKGTLSERAALILIAAIGFAPSAVLHSTQPLKDDLTLALIAAACFGATRVLAPGGPTLHRVFVAILLACSVGVLAGVRSHMASMVIASLLCAGVVFVYQRRRARVLASAALVVLSVGLSATAYRLGAQAERLPPPPPVPAAPPEVPAAGPPAQAAPSAQGTPPAAAAPARPRPARARPVAPRPSRLFLAQRWITTLPSRAAEGVRASRRGFARTRGRTNLASRDEPQTLTNDARGLAIGLAATVIPISVLKATGVVSMTGGQGMLALADVDTLFLDVGILVTVLMLFRHRRGRAGGAAVSVFTGLYAAFAVLLLAYVVTNYGTLFRMRLMMLQALCLLLLAFAGSRLSVGPVAESVGAELAGDASRPAPEA